MSRISIGKKPAETPGSDSVNFDLGDGSTAAFAVTKLQESWSAWSDLESVIRRLDSPLTPEEWARLEGIAATSAAKNGLAELKQAVAQHVKPK